MGLDLEYYWRLNPLQFQKHIDAYIKRYKNQNETADRLNHSLGQYIRIAFNDPKKYPRAPFLSAKARLDKPMTAEEMERQALHNTIRLGGKIDDH